MDTSSAPLLGYGLPYQWRYPVSDSELSSLSSPETLSPVPSMEFSLSPSYQPPAESAPRAAKTEYSKNVRATSPSPSRPGRKTGRTRKARIRSKQRESASEKEKLRMRDLTKALHHLRTYLPPSVAPAGQTLTKIETLRLTIRYISYLSAQLGLSEEVLFQRRERGDSSASDTSSPDILGYLQCGSVADQWAQPASQSHSLGQSQYLPQCPCQPAAVHSGNCSFGGDPGQYSGRYSEPHQGDVFNTSMETVLQSPPATHPASCQMYGKDFCSPLVLREYWG
ncbi:uncharacterized protein ACJ7VT_019080 [Polymixia lowei]